MPEPNGNAESVFTPTAAARDAVLDAFDAAWRSGERPHIADFLPQPGAIDRRLLLELVHTDLQYRFKAGEPARAEDYLAAWSLLADDHKAALELIVAEFQLRRSAEPTLSADEFLRRFPQYAADLSPRLQGASAKDSPGLHSTVVQTDQPELASASTVVPAADVQGAPAAPRRETSTPSRYRTLRFHAKGGIGEVHVAEDSELRREVALKRIQERHGDDAELRRRFLLEAEITARLQHPGIVPVYGLVEDADGQPSYAMRFIEGESLKDAIDKFHGGREQGTGNRRQGETGRGDKGKRGRGEEGTNPQSFTSLEFRKLLGRFIDACNAIEYAHSRGVIHRDIKPANIMLGEFGETLVVDWGLAKVLGRAGGVSPLLNQPDVASPSGVPPHVGPPTSDSEASADSPAHTQQGMLVGTAQYMSPEQAECRHGLVNRLSDVYCLGATLYTLLTGRAPVVGADLWAVVAEVQEGHFPPPRQINRKLAEADPTNAMAQRDLSMSYKNLGNAHLRLGQTEQALDECQRCFELSRKLAEVNPASAEAQRNLSLSCGKLGDVYLQLGQAQQAIEEYQRRIEIDRKLADADPANAPAQRALQASRTKLGDIYRQLGQRQQALEQYQLGLEISRTLAHNDPENAWANFDLLIGRQRLGHEYLISGQTQLALDEFQQCIEISLVLVREDPTSAPAQRNLAVSCNNMGDVTLQLGRTGEALTHYQRALEISRKLADGNPASAEAQRDLSFSLGKLGDVYLRQGHLHKALDDYQRGLEISKMLAAAEHGDARAQHDLSVSYEKLGDVTRQLDRAAEALTHYQKSLEISRKLAEVNLASAQAHRNLLVPCRKLGDLYLQLGQTHETLEHYQRCLEIFQKLAAAEPGEAEAQRNQSVLYNCLGDLTLRHGRATEAFAHYQRGLEISEMLAVDRGDARAQRDLFISYPNSATSHCV